MELSLDFETYSDIDLLAVGTYRYAADPSTEALLLGWAIDYQPVQLWNIHAGESIPQELEAALWDETVDIWAYNAPFERLILWHVVGYPLPRERFKCTMAYAYSLGFTGSLNQVLDQFNMGVSKDAKGSRLIHRFAKPQPTNRKTRRWTIDNDPSGFAEFGEYCKQDVAVERALRRRCRELGDTIVWPHYWLDQSINDRGMPVDRELVVAAMQMSGEERDRIIDAMRHLTFLHNPNSTAQLSEWFKTHDVIMPNMQAATIVAEIAWAEDHPEEYSALLLDVLRLKQEVAKTSVSKWKVLDAMTTEEDPHIRGIYQFVGAGRTGRWAGRKFQPHNLPRPIISAPESAVDALLAGGLPLLSLLWEKPLDALSSALRASIKARPGTKLVVSDLSSIESRLAGYVCGCGAINAIFAKGLDVYTDLATDIFGVPYEDVTKHQRFLAKPAALGAQYMLGGKGLVAYAESFGVVLELDEAQRHIDTYRSKYEEVRTFWYSIEDAYKNVILHGHDFHLERIGVHVSRDDEFLKVRLPTARCLYYYRPTVEPRMMPWGEERDVITYMGRNQFTTQWDRINVHPGKLLENLIQAMARDVLMTGLLRCKRAGLDMIGHVHDEIILVARENEAEATLDTLNHCMADPLLWAPGLLLGAEGYIAERYRKG